MKTATDTAREPETLCDGRELGATGAATQAGGCLISRRPLGLQKILVPVDFSQPSLQALRYAAALAEHFGSSIHLLHVFDRGSFMNDLPNMALARPEEEVLQEAIEQLRRLGRQEVGSQLQVEVLLRRGKPAGEIMQAAESLAIGAIVMSTHGYTGFKRFCMGSTAEEVVRGAPCPVFTIRCAEADDDDAASREEDGAKPWRNRSMASREVATGAQGVEACSANHYF